MLLRTIKYLTRKFNLLTHHQFDKDKFLANLIYYNNFEEFVGIYSIFCSEHVRLKFNIRSNKISTKFKARYYEALISYLNPNERLTFEKQHYGILYNEIIKIKNTLLFQKITDQSYKKYTSNIFFNNRIDEWKNIVCEYVPYLTKDDLINAFEEYNLNEDKYLFNALSDLSTLYFLRKMQYPILFDIFYASEINKKYLFPSSRVLDYGCGAGDLGIYFSINGHATTFVDIEDGILKYVKKRLKNRQIHDECIGVSIEQQLPKLENEYDIIICVEVLEHVRNPLELIYFLINHMNDDGILMLGSFPFHDTNSRGDHLESALSMQRQVHDFIKHNLIEIEKDANRLSHVYFFKKNLTICSK